MKLITSRVLHSTIICSFWVLHENNANAKPVASFNDGACFKRAQLPLTVFICQFLLHYGESIVLCL